MHKIISALLAAAVVSSSAVAAAPCGDAKGKFIKCATAPKPKPVHCKDAKGKFVKCGTPGAKSAK